MPRVVYTYRSNNGPQGGQPNILVRFAPPGSRERLFVAAKHHAQRVLGILGCALLTFGGHKMIASGFRGGNTGGHEDGIRYTGFF